VNPVTNFFTHTTNTC